MIKVIKSEVYGLNTILGNIPDWHLAIVLTECSHLSIDVCLSICLGSHDRNLDICEGSKDSRPDLSATNCSNQIGIAPMICSEESTTL